MDGASRTIGFFNGDTSLDRSSDFRGPTSLRLQNPCFPDFDRTLEAAFSGLHVSAAGSVNGNAGGGYGSVRDSGIGGYGLFSEESKRELFTRLRLLESNYASTGHVGSLDSRSFPAERFVSAPGVYPPATRTLSDLSRRRIQSPVSGNGFSRDRVGGCGDGSSRLKSGLRNGQHEVCVEDLRGMIVPLCKDQNGCRVLQKVIEALTEEEMEVIFSEVMDHVCELLVDPFGNYVVQKLVEMGKEEQRNQILLMLTQSDFQFATICLDMHGTRAVQKLLEHLTTQEQITLVMAALSPGAVALAKNGNGQHVIQYCLKNFSHQDTKYLVDEVADNCTGIAMDKSGCCVLQQCVDYSCGKPRERLVAEITANALLLAEDRYGNYVVQHLLGLREHRITRNLLKKFEGRYLSLSRNKYGSNVVEKCLTEVGEDRSVYIILELLEHPNVPMLLLDPFGNFVIQSALKVSKRYVRNGVIHNCLLDLVRTNYQIMCSNQYGKKILAWFDKRKTQQRV